MFKRVTLLAFCVACLAVLSSCIFDPEKSKDPPPPPGSKYENLTERWHPLHNLELSWNEREITRYDEVLDEDFTFFFSLADVDNGAPTQWDRATEVGASRNMFDPNYSGERRITDIDLDLQFDKANMSWTEIQPQDPKYAGETWYLTTVNYGFTFEADPDWIFINQGNAKAQYTIRQTNGKWRVVEFRDLGGE